MSNPILRHTAPLAAGCHTTHCSALTVQPSHPTQAPPLVWDVFCHVIDNWGDVGVCWRLCRQLAAVGQRVRLWLDDASVLDWMAPCARTGSAPGVRVYPWPRQQLEAAPPTLPPGDVLVEAFGCHIAHQWVASLLADLDRDGRPGIWINLEYLSAEPWVARSHGLPSPVLHGPLRGRTKWFFFPGFSADTGGLLREPDLLKRQAHFDPHAWRARHAHHTGIWVSLFCYEPHALPRLVMQPALADALWLVAAGRSANTWSTLAPPLPLGASVAVLDSVPQPEFDERLWACDLNLVRGEDSLVRALWAGRPFLWQLYPQDDCAHHAKLEAFLTWLDAPPDWQAWLRAWNGVPGVEPPALTRERLAAWHDAALAARARLLAQDDLVSRLLAFVVERRRTAARHKLDGRSAPR